MIVLKLATKIGLSVKKKNKKPLFISIPTRGKLQPEQTSTEKNFNPEKIPVEKTKFEELLLQEKLQPEENSGPEQTSTRRKRRNDFKQICRMVVRHERGDFELFCGAPSGKGHYMEEMRSTSSNSSLISCTFFTARLNGT